MQVEKHVRLWYRGSLFSEDRTKPLDGDFPSPSSFDVPPGVYAFQFCAKTTLTGTLENGETTSEVRWQDVGPLYFPGGVVKSYDEIPDTERNRILRANMKGNGWDKIIYGWPMIALPYEPGKHVVIADRREMTRERWNAEHPNEQVPV